MNLQGLLLVDKPSGWTSFDVVNKVRSEVKRLTGHKRYKVGHAGTLDPLATGLLIVLVGNQATKQQDTFRQLDKEYEVNMRLGMTSTTGDDEGEKQTMSDRKPTEDEVQNVLLSFKGILKQQPHPYSAVKVSGKRAYERARSGETFETEPRQVTIYSLDINSYVYPKLRFTTTVSSGTYIRSLVEDVGTKLGTGAYMSGLNRTRVGKFSVQDAVSADKLNQESVQKNLQPLDKQQ